MNLTMNLRQKTMELRAIQRSNRPLNKYNESMHHDTECITGEPGDRTAYDVGTEQEQLTEHNQ